MLFIIPFYFIRGPFNPPDFHGDGWYRFAPPAGTQLATSPPPVESCGTGDPGWMSGSHPTPEDGEVDRTILFVNSYGDTNYGTPVKVINCNNDFFVYYLVNTPKCFLGYCGQ